MLQFSVRMAQLRLRDGLVLDHTSSAVRVFLLSDDRLLREMLPAALRRQSTILFVGTHSSSGDAVAKILESACDVLLVDVSNDMSSFETHQVLATLKHVHSELKSVTLSLDHGIADLISSIHVTFADGHASKEPLQRAL